jgi:hypothetical protein
LPVNGSRSDGGDFGDFVDREATKKAHLGNGGPLWIKLTEAFQRPMYIDQFGRVLHRYDKSIFQRNNDVVAAAFLRLRGAGVIDQNPAHRLGGHPKEVRSILNVPLPLLN